jgi:hypothetical protein
MEINAWLKVFKKNVYTFRSDQERGGGVLLSILPPSTSAKKMTHGILNHLPQSLEERELMFLLHVSNV